MSGNRALRYVTECSCAFKRLMKVARPSLPGCPMPYTGCGPARRRKFGMPQSSNDVSASVVSGASLSRQ